MEVGVVDKGRVDVHRICAKNTLNDVLDLDMRCGYTVPTVNVRTTRK